MADSERPISEFMTTVVQTVDLETSLRQARAVLDEHGIRHLPVLDGKRLVGVVSERDLKLLETFPVIDRDLASVGDVMADRPYCVAPDTPLRVVVRTMAERKYGSALVADGQDVRGIFTTVDALRTIDALVGA